VVQSHRLLMTLASREERHLLLRQQRLAVMTGKVLIGAHVERDLFDKLEATASALGMSKAALVRLLLRRGLALPVVLSTEKEPPPSD
jgi:hypothetical protein